MKLERVKALIEIFRRQRILVVGDLMLDKYIHGSVERISPEAPVPVVQVNHERRVPGGAANVAYNICALGGQACVAGIVGDDAAGAELLAILNERGIGTEGVRVIKGRPTTVKMRVLADRQQVVRVDWESHPELPDSEVKVFCSSVEAEIKRSTGVVIEDYNKGVVRQEVMDRVLSVAKQSKVPVGLDPKDNLDLKISGLTLATPNYKEAHACSGLPIRPQPSGDPLDDVSLRTAAEILMKRWSPEQLIVTLGAKGMYLAARGKVPQVIPTRAREVFDVSGAGDTVIATCVLAMAAGASSDEAAVLGNNAAGVVVAKLGTATCSPEELIASVEANER